MSPLAPFFLLSMLLCFASGGALVVFAIASFFSTSSSYNRTNKVIAFIFAGSAAALALIYFVPFRPSDLTAPGTWRMWLFLGCVLVPHLLWSARCRHPTFAGGVAILCLVGISPELLSVMAAA